LSDEACYELEMAVDEACTNVIQYAYAPNNSGGITLRCTPLPCGLQVDIFDQGKPFDPTEGGQIARQKQSRDPASGGLGLSMIRQFADELHHRWDEQQGNRLTITKYQKG
jgi:serine/threonine-protein kinase RsbW